MKRISALLLIVFFSHYGFAQEDLGNLDLRFGVGSSLLGTGDMLTIMFENELNVKLNDYFTFGGGLSYAKSDNGVFENASFVQLNSNLLLSPFRNNKRNDFRIGTGVSWYRISDSYISLRRFDRGQVVNTEYEFDRRSSFGVNIIVENTYMLTEKDLIGIKLHSQPYFNGDINSGVLLKWGVKI